jgi:hypothetical protein
MGWVGEGKEWAEEEEPVKVERVTKDEGKCEEREGVVLYIDGPWVAVEEVEVEKMTEDERTWLAR